MSENGKKLIDSFHNWKGVIAVIFTAGLFYAGIANAVKSNTKDISDHEDRIRIMETIVRENIPSINTQLDNIKNQLDKLNK